METAKKFCFVLPNFHSEQCGGAETQCHYLARELIRRGWEVHYIRESDNPGAGKDPDGIHLHAMPKRKKLYKWRNNYRLRSVMREIRSDFWYVRANTSYLFPVTRHARAVGGKVLWAFSRDSQLDPNARAKDGRLMHNAVAHLDHLIFFRALRQVDKILCQTDDQRSLLRTRLNLDGDVIYNAHPPPLDADVNREEAVVWVGRLEKFKNPRQFLYIASNYMRSETRFYVIGGTSDTQQAREFGDLVAACGNVTWLGELELKEVHHRLRHSMILVNTSDYEGFSNVFIEAWMRGVPVVSLRVNPDNLIVEHGLGHVAPSILDAASVIAELLGDPIRWREMSRRCERFARQRFDIKDAVDKLEQTTEILGRGA